MNLVRFALFAMFASLGLIPCAHGQGQAIDALIEGHVRSQDGKGVAEASVRARNVATGLERETRTDASGRYAFPLVQPGRYAMIASGAGFATVTHENLETKAGHTVTVEIVLVPESVSSTVTVTEAVPVVEPGRTVVSNTYEERTVRSLPTVGRSILDFFVIQPGVNARPLSTGGSGTGTPTTTYGGVGLRQMNVDGVSNQLQGGARNLVISQEAVAEFQTVTNFSAEFGRVAGGLQNAFTRSGTNDLHGSGYLFTRQRQLSARPFLLAPGAPTPEFARYNYGGTLAGPIKQDRAFFFGSYERWQQDLPGVLTITGPQADQLRIPRSSIGAITQTFRAHTVTARTDAQISSKNRLSGRFNYYFDRESPLGNGQQSLENLARFDEAPFSFTAQNVTIHSSALVSEIRFLFARRPISNGVANEFAPNINVSGIGQFNGNSNGSRVTREQGFQAIYNLIWSRGRHSFKFGADLLPVWFRERTTNVNGSYQFTGLPADSQGRRGAITPLDQFLFAERATLDPATALPYSYSRFTRSVGQEFFQARVFNQGYYVQDDIRLTSKLKLNAGLRYELFLRPKGNLNPAIPATGKIPQDRNNLAPRLALAFDPVGDGKTVIRGGAGLYYSTTVAQTFNTLLRGNGIAVININVAPGDPGAPPFTRDRVPVVPGARVLSDVRVLAPSFDDIKVINYFLTAEREIARDWALSWTYQGTRSRNLPYAINTNLASAGALPDGRPRYATTPRPVSGYGNIFESRSEGFQNYHGMVAVLTRRFAKGFYVQASHHLSSTKGVAFADDFTGFGIFTSGSDPLSVSRDRGPGDFDMRNRFTLTAVWDVRFASLTGAARGLVNGWQVSSRTIASQGYAFNATTGRDDNGDTVINDRPAGIRYNDFKLPGYGTVDIRLTRNLRWRERYNIELIGEVFNSANRLNPTGVNRVWGLNAAPNASFRAVTAAENQRQFQLAARFSF